MHSQGEDRSLREDEEMDRQNGFMPLDTPVYIGLWKIRKGFLPRLYATLVRPGAPRLVRKPKSKPARKLKTPRMMLPNLLG
ncbi:MAG: hypothetical protein M5U26_28335 [Planctomycetota bacterium]|nr:hypothetical protein [Planctomycetota bacterium]